MTSDYDYLFRSDDQRRANYPPQQRDYTDPYGQYQPADHGYDSRRAAAPPRPKRRVFMWVFLAIQVIFIVWLVAGLTGTQASRTQGVTAADRQQAASTCSHHQWQYLSPSDTLSGANTGKSTRPYSTYAACVADQAKDAAALGRAGSTAGSALGAGLIIAIWVVVDILVGGGYAVYRLASRRRYE